MSNDDRPPVNVTVESSTVWPSLFCFLLGFVMCYGDPDLLDVLEEWCRRYMEIGHGG